MNRAKNKIVLITGAARGIGEATARLFSNEGAKVIVTDILKSEGEKIAKEINGYFYYLDVADENNWQTLAKNIKDKFSKIDIIFNNAGITGLNEHLGEQNPENISLDAWHQVNKVNLDGVFLGCKYGIKLMKEEGGAIINMASRSGMVGIPEASAYAASKAAIRNHTKSVALYCASKNYKIRCNCVSPAAILTPIWEPMLGDDKATAIKNIEAGIPLGKMGEPNDVAYSVLYLASDEAKYITGTEIVIDGGILAGAGAAPKKQ